MGRSWLELAVGVVLWATTQMEQEAFWVLFGWLWADSATAAQNIKDRQSHVSHREINRIRSCIGLDSFSIITVVWHKAMPSKLLLRTDCYVGLRTGVQTAVKLYKRGNVCQNRVTKN